MRYIKKCHPFSGNHILLPTEIVLLASKASGNSTALGRDDYSPVYLIYIGSWGIEYLSSLANLSLRDFDLPVVWKQATIIVLLESWRTIDSKHPIPCYLFIIITKGSRVVTPASPAGVSAIVQTSAGLPLGNCMKTGFNQLSFLLGWSPWQLTSVKLTNRWPWTDDRDTLFG